MRLLFLIPCFALLAGCATPGATSTGGELPASEATYLSDMMVKISHRAPRALPQCR
jgi:hypothetical protein